MLSVSNNWITEARKPLRSASYLKFTFEITDPQSATDFTFNSSIPELTEVSRPQQIRDSKNYPSRKFATLEKDRWTLDGTTYLFPPTFSESENLGWWGNVLSGTDKSLNATLTFTFTRPFDAIGLSINWDTASNSCAEDFDIITEATTINIRGNTDVEFVLEELLTEFKSVKIKIIKWSKAQWRPRLASIIFGINKNYTGTTILSATETKASSVLNSTLPTYTFKVAIENLDNKFNPENPSGIASYIQRRQAINVYWGLDLPSGTEWVNDGVYYLDKWTTSANSIEVSFESTSLLGLLTTEYDEGVYDGKEYTILELMERVLVWSGIAEGKLTKPWELSPVLGETKTKAPLPKLPANQVLQLLAQLAGASLRQDSRTGYLKVYPLELNAPINSNTGITKDIELEHPEVSLDPELSEVEVKVYSFIVKEEVSELFKGSAIVKGTSQLVKINYNSPSTNVTAVVTGGTLTKAEYYANMCKLYITANGTVNIVVSGKNIETSNSILRAYRDTTVLNGETLSIDNLLVTDEVTAYSMGLFAKQYVIERQNYSVKYNGDPSIEALDTYYLDTQFGSTALVVTEANIDYNGAWNGTLKGRRITNSEYPYVLSRRQL